LGHQENGRLDRHLLLVFEFAEESLVVVWRLRVIIQESHFVQTDLGLRQVQEELLCAVFECSLLDGLIFLFHDHANPDEAFIFLIFAEDDQTVVLEVTDDQIADV
jgi:hypothetical protein